MKSRLYIRVTVAVAVLCLVLSGSAFAAELTARIFSGEAKSAKNGRTWAVNLKIIDHNILSGNFVGQIEWPSLNSIYRIEGQLIGARFTFKETEAIRQSSAHLNCEYAGIMAKDAIEGNWIDAGHDQGTFKFTLKTSDEIHKSIPDVKATNDLLIALFSGNVRSTKEGVWKANLRFTAYEPASGNLEGELAWPSLNSIHRITGRMIGNQIFFKEVDYIKRGSALLNREYTARYKHGVIIGQWVEPGADQGSFQFQKK
jgi:hypothetical protein